MYGAVDLLASEYGWSYEKILYSIYPEDFFLLTRQIKLRKIDWYMTQAAIASVPHSDSKEFIENLIATQKFMQGIDPNPQLDREGLESLKKQFNRGKPKV